MHRFGERIPAWLRRTLLAAFVLSYALVLLLGIVGITWPPVDSMYLWQWILARTAGGITLVGALICLASYVFHRWRWEIYGVFLSAVALAGYVLVISTVSPLASRGLLLVSMMLVVVGLYIRLLDCVARTYRWAEARVAGRMFDQGRGGESG